MEKINGVYAINNAIQNGGRPAELTRKQIEEKHGEVATYNLNKPMPYEIYSSMPEDLQKEYLTKLYWTHGGTHEKIGKLFGFSGSLVRLWFVDKKIPTLSKGEAGRLKYERAKKWAAFLHGGTLVKELIPEETKRQLEDMTSDTCKNAPSEVREKVPLEDNPALAIATAISQLRGTGARISIEIVL